MINSIENILQPIKIEFHSKLRLVSLIFVTIFFLAVFNSIIAYLAPTIMLEGGLSEVQMGLVYSTSSIFGFLLDFILAKILKTTHYKKMLLYAILIASLFPLAMFSYPSVILFILGMFFWGLYSNLWGFAYYDFAAREAKIAFHATSLALLFMFLDLGELVGTLLAQPISDLNSNSTIILTLISILALSLTSLALSHLVKGRKDNEMIPEKEDRGNFLKILKVSKILLPLLIFGTLLNIIEAIIWTITPIIERVAPQVNNFGGVILALTIIPSLFTGIIIQRFPIKKGKKKLALISFILGCLFMAGLGFTETVSAFFILTFLYSVCFALVYPLIGGAFADYLQESTSYDNEILSTKDMFANIGYIIGPALGTWLLSRTNSLMVFTFLGLLCAFIALILLVIIPKNIPFRDKSLASK